MKRVCILYLCSLMVIARLNAQPPGDTTQQRLRNTISADFHVSYIRAGEILSVLQYNGDKILTVFKDRTLAPEERTRRITNLENERQAKIKSVLTANELKTLEELKIHQREQRAIDRSKNIRQTNHS